MTTTADTTPADAPTPDAFAGHNGGPPIDDEAFLVRQEIDDLYDEARHWADGNAIDSPEAAEALTKLYDSLHDAGKRADALRVEEKRPHDEAAAAVQQLWNPYVQPKRGKVAIGKESLSTLLAAWRTKLQREAAAKAEAARLEAEALRAEAEAAIRASAGNLDERERAEEQLALAKEADRFASRQERRATTGTGLRTVWGARMTNAEQAMDWAYGRDPSRFEALAQQMAEEAVRSGLRVIPGFEVTEGKVAI